MWRYHLFKKVAFCCHHRLKAALKPVIGIFLPRSRPYAKVTLFIGNQSVLDVVGLPVGVCLNVEPLFVVLRQVTYPQEGSQH